MALAALLATKVTLGGALAIIAGILLTLGIVYGVMHLVISRRSRPGPPPPEKTHPSGPGRA